MIKITRERWVVICDAYKVEYLPDGSYKVEHAAGQTKIFCGLARNYELVPIDEIGDKAVKTYLSKKKAESAFKLSWWYGEELIESGIARAVKVVESITEVGEC